jgi:outer membrane receptor for ferric coprogen and ferric-rhodotorulic acid
MDTTGNILKYRFKHMVKADLEFKLFTKFGVGASYRYYSRMQNIDKAFTEIEQLTHDASPYLAEIKAVDYWKNHDGFHVFDARVSYQMLEKQKLSLIANNLFNVDYSLRPLKIESPRTIAIQYVLTL